ncbi:hypothetical protein F4821DRAFT_132565 [Hypoxylon rubiginosum]|uniref:Uncharacterized protein n=1 Tax=Hypoxylon rubiginosum TaxID=110542 RepID=A0ACC0D0C1_9PEZI|nr:hypothetical protein F4821DRAFT_132565 [Hypoxylon rubiginosum]
MAPVTELILAPINPAVSAAEVASILDASTQTLLAQPGALRVRRSHVLEDPSKTRMFVDWESLEHHQAFAANAEIYGPFRAAMGPLVDANAGPRVPPYHVEFVPFPPSELDVHAPGTKADVTELLHAYFPPDISDVERDNVERTVREFAVEIGKFADGFTGEMTLGWTVEDDVKFKGEPCRVLVGVLGWTSVEAHMKVRDHEEFARVIPMLRNLERLKGMEMCHVACVTTERGN